MCLADGCRIPPQRGGEEDLERGVEELQLVLEIGMEVELGFDMAEEGWEVLWLWVFMVHRHGKCLDRTSWGLDGSGILQSSQVSWRDGKPEGLLVAIEGITIASDVAWIPSGSDWQ